MFNLLFCVWNIEVYKFSNNVDFYSFYNTGCPDNLISCLDGTRVYIFIGVVLEVCIRLHTGSEDVPESKLGVKLYQSQKLKLMINPSLVSEINTLFKEFYYVFSTNRIRYKGTHS